MKKVKSSRLREVWDLIVAAATFLLFACQPNLTVPAGVNATHSDQSRADVVAVEGSEGPGEESPAPPAAPVPAPAAPSSTESGGSVGGDTGATAAPRPTMMARESGGGTVGSVSSHERIETGNDRVRVVGYSQARQPIFRGCRDFLNHLEEGRIDDAQAKLVHIQYFLSPPLRFPRDDDAAYAERVRQWKESLPLEVGYYLIFVSSSDQGFDEDITTFASADEMKTAVNDPTNSCIGDRFVPPWKQPVLKAVPVPQGTFAPPLPPSPPGY